ncbi:unnamed protein product [Adineta steineri]|uniref:Uncharacterized protein n=1 Tax=Adineta steineri TaxID=433720 RepID=A0A814YZB1_9BILA|nr:unnamed protein product [Adineta steineri]CAF4040001.1 unnamed protein product [Adineta steineri]
MEKTRNSEYTQLVKERRQSLKILDNAMMNLSDDNKDDILFGRQQILSTKLNMTPQFDINVHIQFLHGSNIPNEVQTNQQSKDDQVKSAVNQLHFDFQNGKIYFEQLLASCHALDASLFK